MPMRSSLRNRVSPMMRSPLMRTPLVLPRSAIKTSAEAFNLTTAWKRETRLLFSTRSLALPRPMVITGLVNSRMPRLPSGDEMMRRAMGLLADERLVDSRLFSLLDVHFARHGLIAFHLHDHLVVPHFRLDRHRRHARARFAVHDDFGSGGLGGNRERAYVGGPSLEETSDLRERIRLGGRVRLGSGGRRCRSGNRLQFARNVLGLSKRNRNVLRVVLETLVMNLQRVIARR